MMLVLGGIRDFYLVLTPCRHFAAKIHEDDAICK